MRFVMVSATVRRRTGPAVNPDKNNADNAKVNRNIDRGCNGGPAQRHGRTIFSKAGRRTAPQPQHAVIMDVRRCGYEERRHWRNGFRPPNRAKRRPSGEHLKLLPVAVPDDATVRLAAPPALIGEKQDIGKRRDHIARIDGDDLALAVRRAANRSPRRGGIGS